MIPFIIHLQAYKKNSKDHTKFKDECKMLIEISSIKMQDKRKSCECHTRLFQNSYKIKCIFMFFISCKHLQFFLSVFIKELLSTENTSFLKEKAYLYFKLTSKLFPLSGHSDIC